MAESQNPLRGSSAFELTQRESYLWGIRNDQNGLTVGASGGAWASRVLVGLSGTLAGFIVFVGGLNPESFTFSGFPVRNGAPFLIVAPLVIVGVWVDTWRRLRQRIICTPRGLVVRHGFFRTTVLAWSDVADVKVGTHTDSRWDWGASVTSLSIGPRWVTHYDWPIVATKAGEQIDVDGMATLGPSDDWGHDPKTGAEQRVEAVLRYAERHGVAPVGFRRIWADRPWVPHWVWRLGTFVGSVVVFVLARI